MKIICDDRERKVLMMYDDEIHHIPMTIDRLYAGDYIIQYNDKPLLIIERKTWADLAASISDGRKKNIDKLLEYANEHDVKIVYLIEGNPLPSRNCKISRKPYKALRSHLDHIMFRDGVYIIHSKDELDTIERLQELSLNLLTLPEFKGGSHNKEIVAEADDAPELPNDLKIKYAIWQKIPKISTNIAKILMINDIHYTDIILKNIHYKKIADLKYTNGRRIGEKRAYVMTQLNDRIFINMLSCLKGITKETAKIILDNFSIESIINGDTKLKTLSNIQKTTNRKLGKCAAEEIICYFTV